jgi:hypothetical protein
MQNVIGPLPSPDCRLDYEESRFLQSPASALIQAGQESIDEFGIPSGGERLL